jgi:hypothetical protein
MIYEKKYLVVFEGGQKFVFENRDMIEDFLGATIGYYTITPVFLIRQTDTKPHIEFGVNNIVVNNPTV